MAIGYTDYWKKKTTPDVEQEKDDEDLLSLTTKLSSGVTAKDRRALARKKAIKRRMQTMQRG
jgi:hypothetical protein